MEKGGRLAVVSKGKGDSRIRAVSLFWEIGREGGQTSTRKENETPKLEAWKEGKREGGEAGQMVYKDSPRETAREWTETLRGGAEIPGEQTWARPRDQTEEDTKLNNRTLRKEAQIAKETQNIYKAGGKETEVEDRALENYDLVTSFLVRGQAWVKDGDLSVPISVLPMQESWVGASMWGHPLLLQNLLVQHDRTPHPEPPFSPGPSQGH